MTIMCEDDARVAVADTRFNVISVETKYLKSSDWFCFRYCFERCFCAARFTSESNRVSDGYKVFVALKKWEAALVFMASGAGSSSRNRRFCGWRIGETAGCRFKRLCTLSSSAACKPGSFKAYAGNGKCSKCPLHSSSHDQAATICHCDKGFYRAIKDSSSMACTSS